MRITLNLNRNGVFVSKQWLIHLMITLVFTFFTVSLYNRTVYGEWTKTVSIMVVIMLSYQVLSLIKAGKRYYSFEIWFIIMSYLFMFGQVLLDGLFGIKEIEALGYHRTVLDARYSDDIMFHAAVFILLCIQWIFLMLVIKRKEENSYDELYNPGVFSASIPLLIIGIPCHLFYSLQMIIMAQAVGSYNAILDQTGLIDDFANFFIYGLICLIFSHKLNRRKIRTILVLVTFYLVIIMALTGDRRYQIVAIVVVFLSYLKCYDVKLGWKFVGLAVGGYLFLSLFYVLREIRESSLVSIGEFFNVYAEMIFGTRTSILTQTLYEFGGSFYTVCLAIKYVPSAIAYKYGLTLISGVISIIPLGFLYQGTNLFQNGRLAAQLMKIGTTTVGGSIYADLYGNFGLTVSIVVSALIGLLFYSLFNKRENTVRGIGFENARYYILFYALIHLARASFTEVIRTAVWGVAILYLAYYINKRRGNETAYYKE